MDDINFDKYINFIICGNKYNAKTSILIYMKMYFFHVSKWSSTKPEAN